MGEANVVDAKLNLVARDKTPDFYKGNPYSAFTVKLPKAYNLEIQVAEHQSGKVTVRQSVSHIIGFFNLRKMNVESVLCDSFGAEMMDKLNRVLQKERCV
jgi:hypothetical protein